MSIRNKSVAVLAGLAVFAVVSASAATLGGLTTTDVGANSNSVKGPISGGVKVSWTTAYEPAISAYEITGVTLTPVDGSETIEAGAAVKLMLASADGTFTHELTGTWPTLTIAAGSNIPARDVERVSLVVNGTTATAVTTGTTTTD